MKKKIIISLALWLSLGISQVFATSTKSKVVPSGTTPLLSPLDSVPSEVKEIPFENQPFKLRLGEVEATAYISDFLDENNDLVVENVYILEPRFKRRAVDARASLARTIEITPEITGVRVDLDFLEEQLKEMIKSKSVKDLTLKHEFVPPRVKSEDLLNSISKIKEVANKKITISTNNKNYILDLNKNFEMLDIGYSRFIEIGGKKVRISLVTQNEKLDEELEKALIIRFNSQKLNEFLNEKVKPNVEIEPRDVSISTDENGKIVFDGTAQNGVVINTQAFASQLKQSVNSDFSTVPLPMKEVIAKVNVTDDLKARGIKDLVAVGFSNFAGSSKARIVNISTGIKKYDGLIMPKDEVFSFNDHLGPVDAENGFVQELVIKGDRTIPEYGGGLCQVSSTFFRAGLYGGLPITQRKAHSYAVSYYARPGGHGLDCTIYPGVADCKMLNDTQGDILIQAYTEGTDAYFKFYGTSDSRKVAMEGPFYSNHQSPPPQKIVYDQSKPIGYFAVQEEAHAGFDAVWYRHLTKADGTTEKQTFFSKYQARPQVVVRGGSASQNAAASSESADEFSS